MKQIYTKSKKARRCSAYGVTAGRFSGLLSKRREKRAHLQPAREKTFGLQVIRTQRIFLKKDRFGAPIYRVIKHAATGQTALD